jgi:hypothetical protein
MFEKKLLLVVWLEYIDSNHLTNFSQVAWRQWIYGDIGWSTTLLDHVFHRFTILLVCYEVE